MLMPAIIIKDLRFHKARSTLSQPIADATHMIPAIIDKPLVIETGLALTR